jgi:hypothetical protein
VSHRRGVVELLGHVFADALQRTATVAHGLGGFVAHFPPGQIRRQGLALGHLRLRVTCFVAQRFRFLRDQSLLGFEDFDQRGGEFAQLHLIEAVDFYV